MFFFTSFTNINDTLSENIFQGGLGCWQTIDFFSSYNNNGIENAICVNRNILTKKGLNHV